MHVTELNQLVKSYICSVKSRNENSNCDNVFSNIDINLDYLCLMRIFNVASSNYIYNTLMNKYAIGPLNASVLCAYITEFSKFDNFYDALNYIYTSSDVKGLYTHLISTMVNKKSFVDECESISKALIRHSELYGAPVKDVTSKIKELKVYGSHELIKVMLYEYWVMCRKSENLDINSIILPYELTDSRFVFYMFEPGVINQKSSVCTPSESNNDNIDNDRMFTHAKLYIDYISKGYHCEHANSIAANESGIKPSLHDTRLFIGYSDCLSEQYQIASRHKTHLQDAKYREHTRLYKMYIAEGDSMVHANQRASETTGITPSIETINRKCGIRQSCGMV